MHRVVRRGGTVTAAVWDHYSGLPHIRLVWDVIAVLDRTIERPLFRSLTAPDELARTWREIGFTDVAEADLLVRIEFSEFADYRLSFTTEGPTAQFLAGLPASAQREVMDHVQRAYLGNRPDGPRSFASVARACRGTVPA